MATKTNSLEHIRTFYALVANIPLSFHSADLRRFFATFIENDGFECFHYKHRPEGHNRKRKPEDVPNRSGSFENLSFQRTAYSNAKSKRKTEIDQKKTFCCVVKLKESKYQELVQLYHRKHWINRNGETFTLICFISKIKVETSSETDSVSQAVRQIENRQQNIHDGRNAQNSEKDSQGLTESDLNQLQELHPPHIMPQGNIGTPSSVFLELIKQCRLPPKVITKLGLTFPKSRNKAIYSNVMHIYCDNNRHVKKRLKRIHSKNESSHEHHSVLGIDSQGYDKSINPETADAKKDSPHRNADNLKSEQISSDSTDQDDDDDGCEEWERHEALHDDPANIERNKERKYEEELEVVWEKGGPGLVWYTDEQYWRENDGDFDEQTTDDWDVDMSVYYDPYGGDKDARDMVKMRRDTRRRHGHTDKDDIDTVNTQMIGHFEKYTKGIGRKVLEKHGWSEGVGLGSTVKGITYALDNDGQKPTDKTGFGYRGEKLTRCVVPQTPKRRRCDPDDVIISTVYDKPQNMEIPDTLLRRMDHKTMSYREHIIKWKPKHS